MPRAPDKVPDDGPTSRRSPGKALVLALDRVQADLRVHVLALVDPQAPISQREPREPSILETLVPLELDVVLVEQLVVGHLKYSHLEIKS